MSHFVVSMAKTEHCRSLFCSFRVIYMLKSILDVIDPVPSIPLEIPSKPTEGDIHKYSANSIEKIKIGRGNERPLKIEIHMRAEVGFFQVEEVLIPKIQSSPAKSMLELYAGVEGEEMKRYI